MAHFRFCEDNTGMTGMTGMTGASDCPANAPITVKGNHADNLKPCFQAFHDRFGPATRPGVFPTALGIPARIRHY